VNGHREEATPGGTLSGEQLFDQLRGGGGSLKKYSAQVVGTEGLLALLKYEFLTGALGNLPGMIGLGLRRLLYPRLFHSCGKGVIWGPGITLRHPGKMIIGGGVMADEGCLLDARGCGPGEFIIRDDVVISRNVVLSSKGGPLRIGARTNVGVNCSFYSLAGLEIGDDVLIAGHCYVGGGAYRIDDPTRPMNLQKAELKGVRIGDDCWLGAGVIVVDGATVGDHSVVGAGSVVTGDVPPYSVAVGSPARVVRDRRELGAGVTS
jgi:acetyltransferase-like isoleucine patch superfamily enzyme